jgi:AcrR family transcriptional regulator
MRADARDNRTRLLAAARTTFEDDGPSASLNQIAKRAGVGSGTLYRHFPSLQALLAALVADDVDALCTRGRELLNHPSPEAALRAWLGAVARHATAMRGLVAIQMAAPPSGPGAAHQGTAFAGHHDAIRATGAALLERVQAGGRARDVDPGDLLMLVNAAAWASEQVPDDPGLLERLLALVTDWPPRGEPLASD